MAPQPMSFAASKRHCVLKCGESDPPDEAHCSICMEEYNRSEHHAMRIHVALPMPCYHDFCRKCLNTIFERRKSQDGANICPLCRAPWFKAEYESRQAQARRKADEAGDTAQKSAGTANPFTNTSWTSTFSSQTTSTTETSGDAPQQPPRRTPRLYARAGGTAARTARPSAPSETPQPPQDWRSLPMFLAGEMRDAINRQQAKVTTPTAPPPPSQRPASGPSSRRPENGLSSSNPFRLGQQPTPATTASVPNVPLGADFLNDTVQY